MRRISIETGHHYDLLIGSGPLDRCGEEIARVVTPVSYTHLTLPTTPYV